MLALLAIAVIIWSIVQLIWIGLWPMLTIFLGCLLLTVFLASFNLKKERFSFGEDPFRHL